MHAKVQKKVETFFSDYAPRSVDQKQILIHEGDQPAGIFYLESGSVRQYTIDQRGEEIVVNLFYAPAFFPMSWAFKNEPSQYFFEATEKSVVRCAPRKLVLQLIREHNDVSYDLLERVFSGIDGVLMRMVHLMSSTAYIRIVFELVLQSKRRVPGKSRNVSLGLKEYQLGMYCGLTKETVSREIKKLKAKGIVHVDQSGIRVVDVRKLERELDS